MKTNWDYTQLAQAYVQRPDYAENALVKMFACMNLPLHSQVCDVGAGVAHLTIPLARQGFKVTAVEPNDAMRELGIQRTKDFTNVAWAEGTGEATGQKDKKFALVTFGSSFNVTDQNVALKEVKRILLPEGWMAIMWNHRDLIDPIQQKIEAIIKKHIPDYKYGARREDPTEIIDASGFFKDVIAIDGRVEHKQSVDSVIEAWRSHGTLHRQAKEKFHAIIDDIADYLMQQQGLTEVITPYVTKIWTAKLKT